MIIVFARTVLYTVRFRNGPCRCSVSTLYPLSLNDLYEYSLHSLFYNACMVHVSALYAFRVHYIVSSVLLLHSPILIYHSSSELCVW